MQPTTTTNVTTRARVEFFAAAEAMTPIDATSHAVKATKNAAAAALKRVNPSQDYAG